MELKNISLILMISTLVVICGSVKTVEITVTNKVMPNQTKEEEGKQRITTNSIIYEDCSDVTKKLLPSGVYKIKDPQFWSPHIKVACDTKTWGGHWTIILQRLDGSENFYRNYETYIKGFGDLDGDFFLGLRNIRSLTSDQSQQLLVLLEDSEGIEAFETYERFGISEERENYALNTLGKASGTAGDSLSHHHTQSFSTYDRNNNINYSTNCAEKFTGAWWYSNPCHQSNLGGKYGNNTFGNGINWKTFRGFETSLKRAVMMIRPRNLD